LWFLASRGKGSSLGLIAATPDSNRGGLAGHSFLCHSLGGLESACDPPGLGRGIRSLWGLGLTFSYAPGEGVGRGVQFAAKAAMTTVSVRVAPIVRNKAFLPGWFGGLFDNAMNAHGHQLACDSLGAAEIGDMPPPCLAGCRRGETEISRWRAECDHQAPISAHRGILSTIVTPSGRRGGHSRSVHRLMMRRSRLNRLARRSSDRYRSSAVWLL
jgi:hypothetical protein